ncbi:DUF5329 domain-containing protein [Ottowia sp.]|uniref:DUF5329 domain-containing protein n=1 Tax=Ottowia sp. TaxID=1898956 RepID=UPI003A894486
MRPMMFSPLSFMRLLLSAVAALTCSAAWAAPTSAPVRAEIDGLLVRLQTSGCAFSRNGTWYSGAEAQTHLLRKLGYIERRGTVQSTEQFIELAAAQSSSTGQPYQVKCGNATAVPSQQWLNQQLGLMRAAKSKP